MGKNFASDNNAPVHPKVMEAMAAVNRDYALAYGDDSYTRSVLEKFKDEFGTDIDVYFVFNGTAANVLGLSAITRPYHGIISAETAHIQVDECGAPERFTGCKLLTVPTSDGKLTPDQVERFLGAVGNQHHNQPKVVSISQSTEYGTVYTVEEIRALADWAHRNGMYLHMDGARLANAAAFLGVGLGDISGAAGVDVLSFGGAKNGMMIGESVIFFNPVFSKDFRYLRKQSMQLASKMRYIAAQFDALLTDGLWLANARQANRMAQRLAAELARIPEIRITQRVEANVVFAQIPARAIPVIQETYYFYIWNESTSEVRLMTAFDTTEADVLDFVRVIREALCSLNLSNYSG